MQGVKLSDPYMLWMGTQMTIIEKRVKNYVGNNHCGDGAFMASGDGNCIYHGRLDISFFPYLR